MKNIILIGMRGSGKSTIGHLLAKKLGMKFVDSDRKIEIQAGQKIPQIVAASGWDGFRALEKEVYRELGSRENTVIATGGGVVLDNENIEALRTNGKIVLLVVPIAELSRRLERSIGPKRPSLTGKNDPAKELQSVWEERKELYHAAADIITEEPEGRGEMTRQSIDATIDKILSQMAEFV